jgi:hypothetical protein
VQIGADNKKKMIWMLALLAVALAIGIYNFQDIFGGSTAAAPPSVPNTSAQEKKIAGIQLQDVTQDPRLRLDILIASRKIKYEPGRDIFHVHAAPLEPPTQSVRTSVPVPTPPPPPTPTPVPPIPLKYYGSASKRGEPKKVFLADEQGQQQFVVGQGEIVDRRYRLVQIQPNQVIIEDMLTNNRQPVVLTPSQSAPR